MMKAIKQFLREWTEALAQLPDFPACVLFCAFLAVLTGARAQAQITDGYTTRSDLSTSTNWAEVAFAGSPTKSIRLTALEVQSDASTNETWIISGTTPLTIGYSINSTQLVVTAGNTGVVTNQFAIIQHPGSNTCYVVNILYTNQNTNVFIGGPGPVLPALSTAMLAGVTNATLWACTNRARIWPGVGRLALTGEAIHAAQVRAPLAIRTGSVTGPAGGVSNQVRYATVKYGTTGSP